MYVLTYNKFNKYIEKMKVSFRVENEVNTLVRELNDDFLKFSCTTFIDEIIQLLSHIFQDEENNWIEYFCFELDFGKNNDKMKVYEGEYGESKEIPLSTTQDLYNLLIRELELKNKKRLI